MFRAVSSSYIFCVNNSIYLCLKLQAVVIYFLVEHYYISIQNKLSRFYYYYYYYFYYYMVLSPILGPILS